MCKRATSNAGRGTARAVGLVAWLGICLLLGCDEAWAQGKELQRANRVDCSTRGTNDWTVSAPVHYYVTGTNNWVAFSNQASQVFTVEISNFSANDIYLLVFDMGTNAVAGDAPWASPVKVTAGTTGGKDWGATGSPFNGLCVAASTTPNSLTNAAAGLGVITVTRRRDP